MLSLALWIRVLIRTVVMVVIALFLLMPVVALSRILSIILTFA